MHEFVNLVTHPQLMRILAIGDLHGRVLWQQVNVNDYDQVIFIGDYTDSYVYDNAHIYENLKKIIRLKKQQPNRVSLLLGNHDAQYLHFPRYRCSGFRPEAQRQLTVLFKKNQDLFAVAHQEGNYLFTHAGVSGAWLADAQARRVLPNGPDDRLADQLNHLHADPKRQHILFEVGPVRGGYDSFSGPTWADRAETRDDYLPGYHQVVGHTPISDITTFGDARSSITYIDVTETREEFFEITL
ncbi:MAG: metallophosphoesterase [Cytophagaceae bacterium]|nr:metallophosphoesterase [Cytophagaceae bacterium]